MRKEGRTEGRDLVRQRQIGRLISLIQADSASASDQDLLLLLNPPGMSGPFRFGPKGLQQRVLTVLFFFLPKSRSHRIKLEIAVLGIALI